MIADPVLSNSLFSLTHPTSSAVVDEAATVPTNVLLVISPRIIEIVVKLLLLYCIHLLVSWKELEEVRRLFENGASQLQVLSFYKTADERGVPSSLSRYRNPFRAMIEASEDSLRGLAFNNISPRGSVALTPVMEP